MAISEKVSRVTTNLPDLAAQSAAQTKTLSAAVLPDQPLIKIRVSKRWSPIELREIWTHRELLYYLVWRDIKVRYKQTVLGASWIILQPLLMTLVFAIFLGKIAQLPSQGVPHVLFLFSGVLPWTFFSNAVSGSSFSLVINAPLITRVYFPRSMVPIAATLVRLSDFIVAAAVLVMLMFYYRQPCNWTILIAPFRHVVLRFECQVSGHQYGLTCPFATLDVHLTNRLSRKYGA